MFFIVTQARAGTFFNPINQLFLFFGDMSSGLGGLGKRNQTTE